MYNKKKANMFLYIQSSIIHPNSNGNVYTDCKSILRLIDSVSKCYSNLVYTHYTDKNKSN